MKRTAYTHFLALAWLLIVYWIDAANCGVWDKFSRSICSKKLPFTSSKNICARFDLKCVGCFMGVGDGCMNSAKDITNVWNKNTCQYENYCDCENSRQKGKEGQKTGAKHGSTRCCELRKACRSDSCKKGEICREKVHEEGFWCDKECTNLQGGHDYRGKVQVTEYGRVCRPWDGKKTTGKKKPRSYHPGLEKYKKYDLIKNYCRNPSWDNPKSPGIKPWCYTDEPGTKNGIHWEYCDIPSCKNHEAKDQQRHQAETMERRRKSKKILRARTEKTGFNTSIRSDWLKLVNV